MARPSKVDRRRYKLDRRRKRAAVLAARSRYPRIVVIADAGVPSDLAEAVESAARAVRREYDQCPFDADVRTVLRDVRAHGGARAVERVDATGFDGEFIGKVATLAVLEQVFERLPDRVVRAHMPVHYPTINPDPERNDRFRVHVRSLATHKTKFGTVYASAHGPTIDIGGVRYRVGFQRHALDRLAGRFTFGKKPFSTLGAVFQFVDRCQYFEAVPGDGQSLMRYWEPCPLGVLKRLGITDVRSAPWVSLGPGYWVRTGWFPLALGDGWATAKTLLRIGMDRTPEARAVRASRLSAADGRVLLKRAADMTTDEFVSGRGDDVLARLELEAGCSLVRRFDHPPDFPPADPPSG